MSDEQNLIDEMAGKVAGTAGSIQSTWTSPGLYIAKTNRVKVGTVRAKGAATFIEQTCIRKLAGGNQAQFEEIFAAKNEASARSHEAGEDFTHCLLKVHESYAANFKNYALAATGMTEDEAGTGKVPDLAKQTEFVKIVKTILGEPGISAGMLFEVEAKYILTRDSKQPFTAVNYKRRLHPIDLCKLGAGGDNLDEAVAYLEMQAEEGLYSEAEVATHRQLLIDHFSAE